MTTWDDPWLVLCSHLNIMFYFFQECFWSVGLIIGRCGTYVMINISI